VETDKGKLREIGGHSEGKKENRAFGISRSQRKGSSRQSCRPKVFAKIRREVRERKQANTMAAGLPKLRTEDYRSLNFFSFPIYPSCGKI